MEGIRLRAAESVETSVKSLRDIWRQVVQFQWDSKKTKNPHMLSRLLLDARKSLLDHNHILTSGSFYYKVMVWYLKVNILVVVAAAVVSVNTLSLHVVVIIVHVVVLRRRSIIVVVVVAAAAAGAAVVVAAGAAVGLAVIPIHWMRRVTDFAIKYWTLMFFNPIGNNSFLFDTLNSCVYISAEGSHSQYLS